MIFLEVLGKYNVKLDNLDYIELGLWIFLCFILVSGILFFLNRYRKDESSIFLIFSLEFLLFLIARILRIIFKFYIGQPVGITQSSLDISIMQILIGTLQNSAIFLIYLNLEKKEIKTTHFFFSIMSIVNMILIIIVVILSNIIAFILLIISFIIIIAGLPLMYLYLAINSDGNVRKRALIITVGISLIVVSFAMDQTVSILIFGGLFAIISTITIIIPIIQIAGFVIMILGFKKQ